MDSEFRDYIIITMVIFIMYLLYKKCEKEKFTEAKPTDLLKKQINDIFRADLEPMRKMGTLLDDLANIGYSEFNFSNYGINKLILDNLNINTKYSTDDLISNNNIIINDATLQRYNIDVFPRGMIIAFNYTTLPKGWVLCDGKTWYINKNNNADVKTTLYSYDYNYVELKTPDLRNKFIFGSNITDVGKTGGQKNVTLEFNQMPAHTHTGTKLISNKMKTKTCVGCSDETIHNLNYALDMNTYITYNYARIDPSVEKNEALIYALNRHIKADDTMTAPHENMPPYLCLLYLIKL